MKSFLHTRNWFMVWLGCLSYYSTPCDMLTAQTTPVVPLQLEPLTSIVGQSDWDWTHARTAYVPGDSPMWITTMSQTTKLGSHGYHDIYESISVDNGQTWSAPQLIRTLTRQRDVNNDDVVPGDLWPSYHPPTHSVLVTGKTFHFEGGEKENYLKERVSYAVKSMEGEGWGKLKTVDMPVYDHSGASILAANAGCNQPFVLPDGDLLLPIRYQRTSDKRIYTSIVARCRFDGETLEYVEHGSEHTIERDRGLYEPSVISFNGRYFLTLRADHSAFVTSSDDGINYVPIREWKFDDGAVLGSYNTQQHWAQIGDGLFLVYTRRGANNDHIFRHRAPLFIGQVDPKKLVVKRATERVLLPENAACLGNSGICRINDHESWVTCGEVRVSYGRRKGENNQVLFTRILKAP